MRTRIIVSFLIVTQCFLAGCNLRNQPQRRTPQDDPFSTQEPFATPTRGNDTERNRDGINERGRGDTERNRDEFNERDRDDNNERDRNDRERDRENNNERDRGERSQRRRVHCNRFANQVGVCKTHEMSIQAPINKP